MELLNWFKIDCLYPITSGMDNSEELSEVERIQLRNEGITDGYEQGVAVLNLVEDPIIHIIPKCFIPKGKTNRKYYSEIILKSGDVVYAVGRPDAVYEKINEYWAQFEPKQ